MAKMHFDISQFAGVPSATTQKIFKLSDKFSIRAVIDSRFVKAGRGRSGSGGASSAMSGMSGVSGRSSDDDEDGEDGFDDLAVDDVPEPEPPGASSAKNKRGPLLGKPAPRPVVEPSKTPMIEPSKSPVAGPPKSPVAEPPKSPVAEPPKTSVIAEKRHFSPKVAVSTPADGVQIQRSPPPSPPLFVSSSGSEKRKSSLPVSGGGGENVRRTSSPLAMFRRDKGGEGGGRAEDEAKIAKLTEEKERLEREVRRLGEEKQKVDRELRREVGRLAVEVEARDKEVLRIDNLKATADAKVEELSGRVRDLERNVETLTNELSSVKKSKESLGTKCKALEEKNRELGSELDRLTLAVANSARAENEEASAEVERRLASLRKEKEAFETKLKAHEAHSAKVRATYEQLSQMYNDLRDHNAALQTELDETKEKAERQSLSEADEKEEALSMLEDARQDIRDVEASKEALQSDYNRLLVQVTSLQERLDKTSLLLEESHKEVEDLHAETVELKNQRDVAMQRALSRGKSGTANNSPVTPSLEKVEEELRIATEKYEREQLRLTRKNAELEQEVSDLREDLEYEKAEKHKARNERDKIRENVRELERKTSQAARRDDALHSLKRQISTQQMREQDHEMMIADLRAEKIRLEQELATVMNSAAERRTSNAEELSEVLQDLVATKLALAEAEDDKLNLQFSMKQLKKSEKAIQVKLASHASRLEVKLGQANEELERLRRRSGLADATEFTELGSDVDY